ncbi:MAG: carboxypeptidase-like regulatory domain-containing protein [Tannerellaceae bacterium]|nr:carboxypeptidase-like regulatory domain-containing protein [Tannerellaceae bacterium]
MHKKTKEFIRIMKISFVLLFVCVFQLLAIDSGAQNAIIHLPSPQLTVGELIDEIEHQTDYLVIYSNSEIDVEHAVNLQNRSTSVSDYLAEVFSDGVLNYEFENNYIILSKKTVLPAMQQIRKKVSRTVVDQTGEAVIGANIVVKGTTNGTITDLDGNFTLEIPEASAALVISYIGYHTQEIPVNNQSVIQIRLQEDTQKLDEVVVVGYGTQRKGELTSSIASVKSESFIQGTVQDAAQLLQGKVAGLGVILPNGDPTATTQIMLRGVGTLNSSISPLVIIDGVPGDLNTVAPEDIESIDVVKDGSAAAIYGTRGNNGVIFVTTKKVRGEVPMTIDVHSYITTQTIKKKTGYDECHPVPGISQPGKTGCGRLRIRHQLAG